MTRSAYVFDGLFNHEARRYRHHHGKSGQQKAAEGIQAQDIAQQRADIGQQGALTGAAQGTLSQFEGPVQQSPFYKALLTSGIESTSKAYDRARANTAQRAKAAGFGYNQPIAGAAQDQLGAQEAESLAAVPRNAMLETAPLAMDAARTSGQMGMGYGQQGLGYGYQGLGAGEQAYGMNKRRGSIWQDLYNIGGNAASGMAAAGGMSPGVVTS